MNDATCNLFRLTKNLETKVTSNVKLSHALLHDVKGESKTTKSPFLLRKNSYYGEALTHRSPLKSSCVFRGAVHSG